MSDHSTVYDLGDIDVARAAGRAGATSAAPGLEPASRHVPPRAVGGTTVHRTVQPAAMPVERDFELAGTLSLFVPGSGQLLRGDIANGLFVLSSMGFLVSLGWALVETLDRLLDTLRVLGYPGAPGVWALAAIYVLAAVFHVGNILTTVAPYPRAIHPVIAGVASLLVPGWGQILNGTPRRGALFLGSLWFVGALWILDAPPVVARLDGLGLFLPEAVRVASSAAVRFTAPAVIWALAVYDAISSAAAQR